MLRWLLKYSRNWLSQMVIVTSEPLRSDGKWRLIRGDLSAYKFEDYGTEAEAKAAVAMLHSALGMGESAAWARVITLRAEDASVIYDLKSYQKAVAARML